MGPNGNDITSSTFSDTRVKIPRVVIIRFLIVLYRYVSDITTARLIDAEVMKGNGESGAYCVCLVPK